MAVYFYINGADRTDDLQDRSVSVARQLNRRSNSMSFILVDGATKPSENQDCLYYRGDTIAVVAGTTLTLDGYYQKDVRFFYAGQRLRIRIGDTDEETVIVQSYDEDNLQIILETAPSGTISAGDKIGDLMFAGVLSRVKEVNVDVLTNLEYEVEAVGYEKIFDKKHISDSWADVDARYIINDFINTTVNYKRDVDNMAYVDNAAIQAVWTQGDDGSAPTVDSSVYLEGTSSGVFAWVNAGGTATWVATPSAFDISEFVGASSGQPVEGALMLWVKTSDYADITSLSVRIGSSASDYCELTLLPLPTENDWQYIKADFANTTPVGTPDWTAVDYLQIRIVETGNGTARLNGLRVNAEGSFTLFNVDSTPDLDDIRAPILEPSSLIDTLAGYFEFVWYIDNLRDIHFVSESNDPAPYTVTDTSANFTDLKTEVDQSQLGNRIIVIGGEEISESLYAEVHQGDNTTREWVLRAKFSGLTLLVDDNTDTNSAEVGTTTTNIKITGHGLSDGDHIINRTRVDADGKPYVRAVEVVDVDNLTVEAVPSQTNGDTITFFSITKTVGVEGINDEASYDYMGNSNSQSVKSTDSEDTLDSIDYIRFSYYERVPIQLQYQDVASVNGLKALGGLGDGVFDLDTYTDRNIDSRSTALSIAQAKVQEFSNPTIAGQYKTDQYGIDAGQIQEIADSNRGISGDFVIQKVDIKQKGGEYADYFEYKVTFGTSLYGWIEFMQKLLAVQDKIELNTDATIVQFVTAYETVESSDVNQVSKDGGFAFAKNTETVESSDVNQSVDWTSGTWQYEPSVGQTLATRFDLADYG